MCPRGRWPGDVSVATGHMRLVDDGVFPLSFENNGLSITFLNRLALFSNHDQRRYPFRLKTPRGEKDA